MERNQRKSRAQWGSNTARNYNEYANNGSQVSLQNTLQVPNANNARKRERRMSIHATAQGRSHGRSFSQATAPPLPVKDDVEIMLELINTGLGDASAQEIDSYDKSLKREHQLITKSIKTNINENQKQILQLTNDLKDIQEDLVGLRLQTADLFQVFSEFTESAHRRLEFENETKNDFSVPLSKKRDRSSILVVQKMWATELQSLFKHVDGAANHIQPIPGRHVVAESGRWQEVNLGTWKPVKTSHLFILNDLVLIAIKKSSEGGKSKLQMSQCWPLNLVSMNQIESSGNDRSYMINLKYKSLSYVYQTDRIDHYIKITEAFNKSRDELLQIERLQTIGRNQNSVIETDEEKKQLRKSLRNSGILDKDNEFRNSRSSKHKSSEFVLQDISAKVHQRNKSSDFNNMKYSNDKSNIFSDLKNLEDRLDDIDVEIAHNQYEQAVGFIHHIESKLRNIDSHAKNLKNTNDEVKLLLEVIILKLETRRLKILQNITFDLQNNIDRLSEDEIESFINYFESFDQLQMGINRYLSSMSDHLDAIVSKLSGDKLGSTSVEVFNYLANLVVVYLTLIKRVILLYENKIRNIIIRNDVSEVDSSGLINWCMEEISKLVGLVVKHITGTLIHTVPNHETDEPLYVVKDEQLFTEFLLILIPQLNDLKGVGVNADYQFESILELKKVY